MRKREANYELLRIVAMLMIITLHYLDKGGILPQPESAYTGAGLTAWVLEAFCVPAVNVYVLISAYFLSAGDYRPLKVVRLWLQVFFYSAGIAAVLTLLGVIPFSQIDLYRALLYLFPVIEEHYWFVTAYVLMYLLAPLMNDALFRLPEKTYRQGILLLLLFLSVSKSILPVKLPVDRLGYDALWFLCLYLIGVYVRRFEPRIRFALMGYVICSLLIFGSLLAVHAFYAKTGSLGDFINRQYQYNSIFCLLAAIFLFSVFRGVRIAEGKLSAIVCRAASASFGVYLIHEHIDLRYRWPDWLGTLRFADTPLFVPHWIVSMIGVYLACMSVDFVRQALFSGVGRIVLHAQHADSANGNGERRFL